MKKEKKATEQQHPFMKMAGMKDMKKFMDKYPSDEHFFADYPQARYGYMMKADEGIKVPGIAPNVFPVGPHSTSEDRPIDSPSGASQVNLPGSPDNTRWQSVQPKLNVEENVRGLNEAGQMPQQGGYQAAQGPAFKGQMSEEGQQVPEPSKGKHKYKVSGGEKTWDPFAKDNAWNTGNGIKTTDIVSGAVSIAAGALPYQPARQNIDPLQMGVTTGGYGYGSHAAAKDGAKIAKSGKKLSATKAREMLHNPPHGQDLSEKQRKYFGAVASGYAADGGPMITEVQPSPYTHFMPMTRQNRQVPETPNYYIAYNGMSMQPNIQIPGVGGFQPQPVQGQSRNWDKMNALHRYAVQNDPNYGTENLQHGKFGNPTLDAFNKANPNMAISVDELSGYQQEAINDPSVKKPYGTSGVDKIPGKMTLGYSKPTYDYTHTLAGKQLPGQAGYLATGTTPLTQQQLDTRNRQGLSDAFGNTTPNAIPTQMPSNLSAANEQPIGQGFGKSVASSTMPLAKGFPTMEEAKAKSKGKPQKENWYAGANKPTGDIRGNEMRNGGEIAGMYHPGDDDQRMVYPYPTKIGGHYHPYDHTYMEQGGQMVPIGENGLQVEKNQFEMISPYTALIKGKKHSEKDENGKGGTDISYNGINVEAEEGETFHVDNKGGTMGGNNAADGTDMNAGIVGGNLYITDALKDEYGIKGNMKYKDFFADVIAKEERKTQKSKDKVTSLSKNIEADNKYEAPLTGTIRAMASAIDINTAMTAAKKQKATDEQNLQLDTAKQLGIEPKELNKIVRSTKWGGKLLNMAKQGMSQGQTDPNAEMAKYGIVMAKDGIAITKSSMDKIIEDSSKKYNIPVEVAKKLVGTESGGRTGVVSSKGAVGHMQIMPATAKQYGVSKEQLASSDIEDVRAATDAGMHYLSDMAKKYNGDITLALAAYNGGPAAVEYVKDQLDKDVITGEDLVNFYSKMRETNPTKDPNAWQNQTLDYVNKIYPEGVKGGVKEAAKLAPTPQGTPITGNAPKRIPGFAPDIQGYNPTEYDSPTAVAPINAPIATSTPADPYERNLLDKIQNNQATVAEIREYNTKYGRQADEQNATNYNESDAGIENYDPNKAYAQEFDENGKMTFVEDTSGYQEPTKDGLTNYTVPQKLMPAEPGQMPNAQLRTDIPALPNMKTNKELDKDEAQGKKKGKGLRNKFRVTDYLGQLKTMFDKAEPVQSMQVKPFMETPYNVSFQNEKNTIQSAFAPALKSAKTPAQQAAISAQMSEQLANVDAKEFQFNQQNKGQIEARNLGEMKGVRDTNLKLGMDAMDKTQRAKAITEADKTAAAQSISIGEAARRAKNLELGMYEQYGGYSKDAKGNWVRLAPPTALEEPVSYIQDPNKQEKVVETDDVDKQGKARKKKQVTTTDDNRYYGGQMAYFGIDMPAGIPRKYFGGGAMGGGHGTGGGAGHAGGGHRGGMQYMGDMMASRYGPGDDSYYHKKKKKKHHKKS